MKLLATAVILIHLLGITKFWGTVVVKHTLFSTSLYLIAAIVDVTIIAIIYLH